MNEIPSELMNLPLAQWQLNLTTLTLITMLLGRAYKGIRKGGGLRGLWRGLIFGENIPDKEEKK